MYTFFLQFLGILLRTPGEPSLKIAGLYYSSWFIVFLLHCISFLVLYCIVLFCRTVHYCLFSFLIFSLLATSSIKLNLNLSSWNLIRSDDGWLHAFASVSQSGCSSL